MRRSSTASPTSRSGRSPTRTRRPCGRTSADAPPAVPTRKASTRGSRCSRAPRTRSSRPPELEERVLSVLAEEWTETPSDRAPARADGLAPWLAVAACLALLAGALAWGAGAQRSSDRTPRRSRRSRATRRRTGTSCTRLGGTAVRTATLTPQPGSAVTGTAVLYDSDVGQSWVLVLARQPVASRQGVRDDQLARRRQAAADVPHPVRRARRGVDAGWSPRPTSPRSTTCSCGTRAGRCWPQGTAADDHS